MDELLSALAVDLAISRVSLAAVKAKHSITPSTAELNYARELHAHLSILVRSLAETKLPPQVFPDAEVRDLLEKRLASYIPGYELSTANKPLVMKVLTLLELLTSAQEKVTTDQATELFTSLRKLSFHSEPHLQKEVL